MRGIAQAMQSLFAIFGVKVAPWFVPVAMLLIVFTLYPMLQKNAQGDKARRMLRKLPETPVAERPAVESEALAMVGDDVHGLLVVAQVALDLNNKALARTAAEKLRATGKKPDDVRRILAALDDGGPRMVEQALVRVERALEMGLLPEARRRIDEAKGRWPGDPSIDALELKVAEAESARLSERPDQTV